MTITGRRREWKRGIALLITSTIAFAARAERINQEGRILGPAPSVAAPTLFNTPQADAIVSAMQIFPVTSAWNEDISRRPLLANSSAMIAQIKADLSLSRQTLRPFYEMNYVVVPDNQPRVTIPFLDYPDESDLDGGIFPNGSYPIPPNMPIETWPKGTGSLTLQQWQMDVNNTGGDRHGITVALWCRLDLGDVANEVDLEWLAGLQRREVRSQFQRVASRRLDLWRRGWAADVSGGGAL